jgi:hypothetical protein
LVKVKAGVHYLFLTRVICSFLVQELDKVVTGHNRVKHQFNVDQVVVGQSIVSQNAQSVSFFLTYFHTEIESNEAGRDIPEDYEEIAKDIPAPDLELYFSFSLACIIVLEEVHDVLQSGTANPYDHHCHEFSCQAEVVLDKLDPEPH